MTTTWHIAQSDGSRLLFFAGFAPGGEPTISDDRQKAFPFVSGYSARSLTHKLNITSGGGWFPAQYAEVEE